MHEKKQILIAHSNETVCKGPGAIVREEAEHSEVYEVVTCEELQAQMEECHFDLIMLHQSFLTSKIALSPGRFVLLATEPTIEVFMFACLHSALAYVMENISRSLLHQILHLVPGAFISDTVVRHCLSEYIAHHLIFSISSDSLESSV